MSALFSASSRIFVATWPASSSYAKPVPFQRLAESDVAHEIGVGLVSIRVQHKFPLRRQRELILHMNANQSRSVGFGTRGEGLVVGYVFGKRLASLGELAWFVFYCKTGSL